MRMTSRFMLVLAVFGFATVGCSKKMIVKEPEVVQEKPVEPEKPIEQTDEPSLRGKEYQNVPEIGEIYFDLDSSSLRNDARETLKANAEVLKKHADWEVLVEGHCDERGTTEYNLGLGQRRAASVREYYSHLGIAGTKVATISYGKENPSCSEQNEGCWSKNRRGVSKVRSTKAQ